MGLDMGLIDGEARPRLEAYLRRALSATSVRVENVRGLGGGAIQHNLALDLAIEGGVRAGRLAAALRATPPAGIAASRPKREEFALLKAAHVAGTKVPEPLLVCDDEGVIGAAFILARRVGGIAAGHRVVKSEAPQVELAAELGRQLGRLHALAWTEAPGLGFLSPPAPTPALAAAGTCRAWIGDEAGRDPVLAWGLRWIERNAPPAGEVVLCHRDYRTGNYLVEDGRLAAILDWEFAGLSDPMEDLGWFCARSWRFGRVEREAGGIAGRADFYAGYEETAGRRVDAAAVAYWEAVAYLRWAAIALLQARRHASGAQPSIELALTGRMLPEIGQDLLLHLDHLNARGAA